jgi:hypothetical protein
VAAIVVALLLILIILLPILLTLNRSTSDSAQDSNSNSSFGFGFGNSSFELNNLTNWNITDLLNAVLNEEEANGSFFFPLLPSRPPFIETTLTTASTTETTTPSTPASTNASTTLTTLPPNFGSDKDSNASTVILTEKSRSHFISPRASEHGPVSATPSTTTTTTTTTTPSTTTSTTTAATTALAPVVHPTIKVPPVANCTGFGFRCANDPVRF